MDGLSWKDYIIFFTLTVLFLNWFVDYKMKKYVHRHFVHYRQMTPLLPVTTMPPQTTPMAAPTAAIEHYTDISNQPDTLEEVRRRLFSTYNVIDNSLPNSVITYNSEVKPFNSVGGNFMSLKNN
jgi:hypothetical protein